MNSNQCPRGSPGWAKWQTYSSLCVQAGAIVQSLLPLATFLHIFLKVSLIWWGDSFCIPIWQNRGLWQEKKEETCALWWIRIGVTVGILKCYPVPAHLIWSYWQSNADHTFRQGNLHRPLSQQSISHHRRVQRLPCWIFAKTWTAHRPVMLMLRSLLLETSIRLTLRRLYLTSINILTAPQEELRITITRHSKMTAEQNLYPHSGWAPMQPSCSGQSM